MTEILGLPAVTAKHQARQSHGFLAGDVPRDLAYRLRETCAAQGIVIHLVPQSQVIPAIKPVRVHRVWLTDDALCVQAPGYEAKMRLDWDTLRLIAVTNTTRKESHQHWETPPKTPIRTPRVITYTEEYAEHQADIFAVPPEGMLLGVRLFSWQVNYAEALGDTRPDALHDANARPASFCLLISSILARATRAHLPPESRALLHGAARGGATASSEGLAG